MRASWQLYQHWTTFFERKSFDQKEPLHFSENCGLEKTICEPRWSPWKFSEVFCERRGESLFRLSAHLKLQKKEHSCH